jgi:hypothetical protein
MFLGVFTVSEGKGKLEKILKKIFEFSPVSEGKGKLEKILKKIFEFSAVPEGKDYLRPSPPPHASGKPGNIQLNISCEPVLSFGNDRHPRNVISPHTVHAGLKVISSTSESNP